MCSDCGVYDDDEEQAEMDEVFEFWMWAQQVEGVSRAIERIHAAVEAAAVVLAELADVQRPIEELPHVLPLGPTQARSQAVMDGVLEPETREVRNERE